MRILDGTDWNGSGCVFVITSDDRNGTCIFYGKTVCVYDGDFRDFAVFFGDTIFIPGAEVQNAGNRGGKVFL